MEKNSRAARNELLVLERHFLDEARFKIESLLSMYNIQEKNREEIKSFVHELQQITKENISLIS